jgi:threonine/homoserine/homoserine lactone efflux protein
MVASVFALGFVEAIPVGATQLEIARRSLNGFFSSALMIVAGSVLSDAIYGVIAFWGVAPFLRNHTVVSIFWIVGAAVSAALGIWAVREGNSRRPVSERSMKLLKKHDLAFATGFSLAVTNPFMIAYWLIGASVLKNAGLVHMQRMADKVLFLVAGSLGIGTYLLVLATVVFRVKHFLSEVSIRRITLAFGIVLLALSSYFAVRAATVLKEGDVHSELFGYNTLREARQLSHRPGFIIERFRSGKTAASRADYECSIGTVHGLLHADG